MSQPRKVFSFAKMMVLAQRRHDARQAAAQEEDVATSPTPAQRDEQARAQRALAGSNHPVRWARE
jgi:hypothetical protein